MTDWNKVKYLKSKQNEIANDDQMPVELKFKILKAIETQIQQEFECATRCQLKPDTVIKMQPPLEFEPWD